MVDFRESFRKWVTLTEEKKVEAEDGKTQGVIRVDTELADTVHTVSNLAGHTVHADEPPERGGLDAGPPPLHYFIFGLLSCTHYHYAHNAVLMGVGLKSLRMRARAYFNRTWTFTDERSFSDILYEAYIDSTATEEEIRKLAKAAEDSCYVMNTLKKAVNISGDIYLRDKKVARFESSPKR